MTVKPLLNDAELYPSDDVISAVLGSSFGAYKTLIGKLPERNIEPEWRYYKDGGSWLCKATAKKKTVFWLSVWQGRFNLAFYFTEKTRGGIAELSIADEIKTRIANEPPMGKLIPLVLEITDEKDLIDACEIIAYKQSCK